MRIGARALRNFVSVKRCAEALQALRMFILQGLYRSPADYSEEALDAASKGYDRLTNAVRRIRDELKGDTDTWAKTTRRTQRQISARNPRQGPHGLYERDERRLQHAAGVGRAVRPQHRCNRWIDKGIATKEHLQQASDIFKEMGGDVLGVVREGVGSAGSVGSVATKLSAAAN